MKTPEQVAEERYPIVPANGDYADQAYRAEIRDIRREAYAACYREHVLPQAPLQGEGEPVDLLDILFEVNAALNSSCVPKGDDVQYLPAGGQQEQLRSVHNKVVDRLMKRNWKHSGRVLVRYRSSISSMWYTDRSAAGAVDTIEIDGYRYALRGNVLCAHPSQQKAGEWISVDELKRRMGYPIACSLPEGTVLAWRRKRKPHYNWERGIYTENDSAARDQFNIKSTEVMLLEWPTPPVTTPSKT